LAKKVRTDPAPAVTDAFQKAHVIFPSRCISPSHSCISKPVPTWEKSGNPETPTA